MDNKKELIKIEEKIRRACGGYFTQVWIDNGLFEVHNVKQEDYNYILGNLNRIKEVRNINHTSRYDFNKPFFGVAPKIYTIRGNFSLLVDE
jgi:hypothetical protein